MIYLEIFFFYQFLEFSSSFFSPKRGIDRDEWIQVFGGTVELFEFFFDFDFDRGEGCIHVIEIFEEIDNIG